MATTSAKKTTGGGKKIPSTKTGKENAPVNGTKHTDTKKFDLHKSLREYFGFDKFKDHQEKIIESLLAGHDTFVIMPTGGGKSLCYQLPAMISQGVAIIVSPLIALMKNQVDLVRGYSSNDEVAHFLNSTLTKKEEKEEHNDLLTGKTKMWYVAPKTLRNKKNLEFFSILGKPFLTEDKLHGLS